MQLLPWIMKNMMGESPKKIIPECRPLGEAELRVQRSLKRLDVPDWYTNKVRPSPKIIKDRRPIECRPAPWKDTTKKQARMKKSLESAVKLEGTRRHEQKNIANDEAYLLEFVELPIGRPSNISKTFPKMSPSRKIQNINIVFPPIEKPARSSGESVRSAGISESSASSGSKKLAESTKTATVSQLNRTMTIKTPKKSADPRRSGKIWPTVLLETDFPVGSTESIVSMSAFAPQKMSSLKNQTKSITSSTPLRAEIVESRPGSTLPSESYSCRGKLFDTPAKTDDSRQEIDTESSEHNETLTSMTEKLFASPNKSMAMERIIKFEKSKNTKAPKKGLVEEIIQELASKCKSKVKTTRASSVSKTFVKRLVRALEAGPGSETESELDGKSVTVSSSENATDTSESSRCSPFENFRRELEDRRIAALRSAEAHFDEHDSNVFWIPIRIPKMPRTSSVKSIIASRITSLGHELKDETKKRPSISDKNTPISEKLASTRSVNSIGSTATDRTSGATSPKTNFDWGKTYRKENSKLIRIEEARVIDSGYSGTLSPSSSLERNDHFRHRDIDTKGWVSEIGDDFVESCLRQVEYSCGIPMRKQRVTAV